MPEAIDFYFDFSSPYGYLAAQRIDEVAARHGRVARWRPILLGVVFKETGMRPLAEIPLKGDYLRHDVERSARRLGVPFRWPKTFPFVSVAAARACLWARERDEEQARRLARALYHHAFGEGRDISGAANVVAAAGTAGVDSAALERALADPDVKAALRREVEEGIEAGVFGSPFFIVDGESFWGHDRLPQVEEWLSKGGW